MAVHQVFFKMPNFEAKSLVWLFRFDFEPSELRAMKEFGFPTIIRRILGQQVEQQWDSDERMFEEGHMPCCVIFSRPVSERRACKLFGFRPGQVCVYPTSPTDGTSRVLTGNKFVPGTLFVYNRK